jgi:hypothetical protein
MKNHQLGGNFCKSVAVAALVAAAFVSTAAHAGETCDALSKRASVLSALYQSMWNNCQQSGSSFNVCYETTETWRAASIRAWDEYSACRDQAD